MATATASSEITDGPVLTLINKRIRNLRKKLNRITQLEQSLSQGKSAIKNKEQEDLLKSKPSIVAAVDELEKFRQPLSVAVDEEINLAIQNKINVNGNGNGDSKDKEVIVTEKETVTESEPPAIGNGDESIEDLLSLIYFGSMFDVKSRSDFDSIMLTRTHERNCCLTYDYVTDDDANVMLGESDLDLISSMGSMLISRPVNSSFSHQNALQRCVEHAKLWLAKSDQPIDSNSNVTYAQLREKLVKIFGSEYLKITPEMKATAEFAAEAAGNYSFQVPVEVENSVTQHEQKADDVSDFQRNETHENQSGSVEDHSKQHEAEAENFIETPVQMDPVETQAGGPDYKEQYVPRRSHHNQRGGGGSGRNGGGGGGWRAVSGNGRGGRSGGRGGPYQNGRNQYNDQPGNYYPRNYYGGRGRGGRGSGSGGHGHGGGYAYNNNASRVEVAES